MSSENFLVFGPIYENQRVKGIEPSCAAWEAAVLPLNYTRILEEVNSERFREVNGDW